MGAQCQNVWEPQVYSAANLQTKLTYFLKKKDATQKQNYFQWLQRPLHYARFFHDTLLYVTSTQLAKWMCISSAVFSHRSLDKWSREHYQIKEKRRSFALWVSSQAAALRGNWKEYIFVSWHTLSLSFSVFLIAFFAFFSCFKCKWDML